jgi:UDP-N-acetylglucosamine transferase subunit ALG13
MELAKDSDVVISHCGIGTILEMLANGISPLVMPRSREYREHVDNHQIEAVHAFLDLGLISHIESNLTRSDLFTAASKYVEKSI